jgi:hypothetical protein
MTPKELAAKYRISRGLLPAILQKSYRQVDNYYSGKITPAVRSQCWLIDKFLSNGGTLSELVEAANRSYDEIISTSVR